MKFFLKTQIPIQIMDFGTMHATAHTTCVFMRKNNFLLQNEMSIHSYPNLLYMYICMDFDHKHMSAS